MGRSEGTVMKGYFRSGTFEISDKFAVVETYSFEINKEESKIDFSVNVDRIQSKHINSIISEDEDEIKKRNYWVRKKVLKKIKIDNKDALIIQYKRKESKLQRKTSKKIIEICYIKLSDKSVLKIKGYSFIPLFENGRSIWESLYKSYKEDNSGPYKTNFGSFIVPDYAEDYSNVNYLLNGEWKKLSVSIEYINDLDHERNNVNSNIERLLSAVSDVKISKTKRTLTIDNKTCYYFDVDFQETDKNKEKLVSLHFLDDMKPGLRITIESDDAKIYDKYKNEIDHFIKSIKFFK